MQHEVKFSLGSITYRLPNVPETLRLVGKLGISENGLPAGKSMYEFMADFIEHVGPFIVSVNIKQGKKTIKTWEEALAFPEVIEPCTEIMNNVMTALRGGSEDVKKS